MRKFLLITGTSGGGKSYIEKLLVKNNHPHIKFHKLLQVTTRAKRDDEDPYIFLTKKEYDNISDTLLAKTNFHGNFYGTQDTSKLKDDDGKLTINTVVVNRLGYDNIVKDLKEKYPDSFDLMTIRITNDSPVERDSRDQEFITKEHESLNDIVDMDFYNSPDKWLSADDIIKGLYEREFIYELESI
jgi:guanylate kinase